MFLLNYVEETRVTCYWFSGIILKHSTFSFFIMTSRSKTNDILDVRLYIFNSLVNEVYVLTCNLIDHFIHI